MKRITKLLAIFSFLAIFTLVGCTIDIGGSNTPTTPGDDTPTTPAGDDTPTTPAGDDTPTTPAGDDDTPVNPGDDTPTTPVGDDDTPTVDGYRVSYNCDSESSVLVYYTQDYTSNGIATSEDYSRSSETGDPIKDGSGQANFKIVVNEGYVLDKIEVTGTYKQIKGPADTGAENVYRVTKIASDITVNIITKVKSAEMDGYKVTFDVPSGVTITVYDTQALDNGKDTLNCVAKNGSTGLCNLDGSDQVNFKITVPSGYTVDAVSTNNANTGLKTPFDTGVENTYRVTKVNADTTIFVTIKGSDKYPNAIKPLGNIAGSKDYYDEAETLALYNDLFDLNNKLTVQVNVSSIELKKIEADYQSDTYRMADSVTITLEYPDGSKVTKTINQVGIKMKGNTTRHSFFDTSSNTIKDLCHFKLSFQETFDATDEYAENERVAWTDDTARSNRKNRTFFGLAALEMKYNTEGDLTYTRDVYTGKVNRNSGVYAQNVTMGILSFNIDNNASKSGSLGLYKMAEPFDRIYLKRYFPSANNDGDLYKCSWGKATGMPNLNTTSTSAYGVDLATRHSDKTVSYALKTNKSSSTQEMMRNFLGWLNGSTADLNATVSQYMDEDYFVTFLALQYLSGDWDNVLYDSNNYYLYFDETGLCYFLPYDMDKTMGCRSKEYDMGNKTPQDSWNLQGDNNRSKVFSKTIFQSNSSLMAKYKAKIKELAPSVLDDAYFTECYNKIYNNYKNDIMPTITTLKNNGSTNVSDSFYHLNISPTELIRLNDSSNYNNAAVDSYFVKKRTTVNNNC